MVLILSLRSIPNFFVIQFVSIDGLVPDIDTPFPLGERISKGMR